MNDSKYPVRFITFEGGEGAGKSTVINQVEQYLLSRQIPVVKTREPGGTAFGEEMRNWLLNHKKEMFIGAKAELLLFLAARAQHIEEVIAPALQAGKVVLCDRFNDSTIAYQSAGRGLSADSVKLLCELVVGSITPDLTFLLDVDPQIGLIRTREMMKENAHAGQVDRIEAEKIDFHQRVRKAFIDIAHDEHNRICLVDANQPQQVVSNAVLKVISTYL